MSVRRVHGKSALLQRQKSLTCLTPFGGSKVTHMAMRGHEDTRFNGGKTILCFLLPLCALYRLYLWCYAERSVYRENATDIRSNSWRGGQRGNLPVRYNSPNKIMV
eukprot:GEMP01015937.1.p2 GENE.GEMP01015937.1~~GEMP01015937.1.p2  ORF type:complete len:106 (-),score=8.87 GEMP01015937.1:11-328(-)